MGRTQRTRRLAAVVVAISAMLALAACGRVDLETLTPEAVRTQEAAELMTAEANPGTDNGDGTPGSDGGSGGPTEGDLVAGRTQYNTWCSNCHDTGRLEAPPIKGTSYDAAEVIPQMRADGGAASPHPVTYSPATELTDNQLQDIFAYLASETAP
jgi:mono/diheme cytochrome c family protein